MEGWSKTTWLQLRFESFCNDSSNSFSGLVDLESVFKCFLEPDLFLCIHLNPPRKQGNSASLANASGYDQLNLVNFKTRSELLDNLAGRLDTFISILPNEWGCWFELGHVAIKQNCFSFSISR